MRDGNAEIYVMNADASRQHNLTRNAADDSVPGGSHVFVINADGSSPRLVARVEATYGDLAVAPRR